MFLTCVIRSPIPAELITPSDQQKQTILDTLLFTCQKNLAVFLYWIYPVYFM